MVYAATTKELQSNQHIYKDILCDLDSELILWRMNPEKWNLLDIICHLVDEEREDFRYRLKHVLETPQLEMPSINPVGWVTERNYQEQDYYTKLHEFLEERTASIQWLTALENPKWDNVYLHPKLGELSAGMFLHNWLAHDYLHIRQILTIKYHYLKLKSQETLGYAGDW